MSERWTCKTCKSTVPAGAGSRQTHLSGTVHAEGLARKKLAKAPLFRAPRTWTCEICHITMAVDSGETHRAGKKHLKKLRAEEEQAKSTMAVNPSPTVRIPKPPKALRKPALTQAMVYRILETKRLVKICNETKPQWWTCNHCDITMYADGQETHENGKCKGVRPVMVVIEPYPLRDRMSGKWKPGAVSMGLQKRLDLQQRAREHGRDGLIEKRRGAKSATREQALPESDGE